MVAKPRILSKTYWSIAGLTALSVMPSIDQVKYYGELICGAVPMGEHCKIILAIILFGLGVWGRETASGNILKGVIKSS